MAMEPLVYYPVEEVIRLLTRIRQLERSMTSLRWYVPFTTFLIVVVPCVLSAWSQADIQSRIGRPLPPWSPGWELAFWPLVFLPAMALMAVILLTGRHRSYTEALHGLQEVAADVRLAGPLAESLRVKHWVLRARVEGILPRILGLLREEDAGLLNQRQRESLHRALFGANEYLTLAILPALAELGDVSALPSVQRLAQDRTSSAEVREAAVECEKILQARLEAARSRERLLRPAGPAAEPSDTLLRPAVSAHQTPAEQLLRASDAGKDDG